MRSFKIWVSLSSIPGREILFTEQLENARSKGPCSLFSPEEECTVSAAVETGRPQEPLVSALWFFMANPVTGLPHLSSMSH